MNFDVLVPLNLNDTLIGLPILETEERSPLYNRTHEFLDRIFPPKEQVLVQKGDGRHNWVAIQILQYGKQGSGKTEFARWLLAKAIEKYGAENVEGWMSHGDLKALITPEFKKPVVILYDDDATLEKLDNETVKALTRIRHICQERTGLDTGLVIVITALHRFHASDPLMRTNLDVLVVRNLPANLYDKDVIRQYVGVLGLLALEEIEERRKHDRSALGEAVFANPYSQLKGIVKSQLVDATFSETFSSSSSSSSEKTTKKEDWNLDVTKININPTGDEPHKLLEAFKAVVESANLPEKEKELCIFLYEMLMNDRSYADDGQRFTKYYGLKFKAELVGRMFEKAWVAIHPEYYHIGGKGRVDVMRKDGKEWVEIKYRGTDYSWSPNLNNLSEEALDLMKRGIGGKCVVISYKPRHNQHTKNQFFVKEFQFPPTNTTPPPSSCPSLSSSSSLSSAPSGGGGGGSA